MEKKVVIIMMVFGSLIGTYVPRLFGAGMFSAAGIIGGVVGGILGIYLVLKFFN